MALSEQYKFRPWHEYRGYPEPEMRRRARELREELHGRRSIRSFSDRPVPREIIEDCLRTAGSAPSGANMQPWQFVAIADPGIKRQIREAAEEEERHFYQHRASEHWLKALAPLGTDASKPFLERAPWLIAIFEERWGSGPDGQRRKHYYPTESVGLASGFLLAALHHAGLATLTHTPSPMKFLNRILDRPGHERPFLLLVTGYPEDDVEVPDISRKRLDEISVFLDGPGDKDLRSTDDPQH